MTHLPYIAASYGLAVLVMGGFGIGAWLRVGTARRRLDAIDPRRAEGHAMMGYTPGLPPWTPTKWLCLLELRQGRWPLEPFILGVEQEGPIRTLRGHGRPLPFQRQWTDCKGLALCWGQGAKPLRRVRGRSPRP